MKIAVVAANGRSGKAFVKAALVAGHSVRAGVHGTYDFAPHANLEVVSCDATNTQDVERLVRGQDAVASFIGHTKNSPDFVQTDAMKVLVTAMQAQQMRRIISLTGTGVRRHGDIIPLVDHLSTLFVKLLDPKRIADGKQHVEVLEKSALDWTVIRVMKLQDVPPRPFRLTPHGPTKWYVGRDEVAQAALQLLEESTFIKDAPIISRV